MEVPPSLSPGAGVTRGVRGDTGWDMGGWSSEESKTVMERGGREVEGHQRKAREKNKSVLLKTPNWCKSLRGHGEQLRPTISAQGAARWAPTPSTPKARGGDNPTPGTVGQGTGRYRQVVVGALAAPAAEQGQLSSPPGVALPLARGMGAGVAWDGCLSCNNSLLPSTVAPWGQKELAAGTGADPLWG